MARISEYKINGVESRFVSFQDRGFHLPSFLDLSLRLIFHRTIVRAALCVLGVTPLAASISGARLYAIAY